MYQIREMRSIFPGILLCVSVFLVGNVEANNPNYRDALAKSILFFQGQRSGRLPNSQQLTWRSSSGLFDGRLAHVRVLILFLFFFFTQIYLFEYEDEEFELKLSTFIKASVEYIRSLSDNFLVFPFILLLLLFFLQLLL